MKKFLSDGIHPQGEAVSQPLLKKHPKVKPAKEAPLNIINNLNDSPSPPDPFAKDEDMRYI